MTAIHTEKVFEQEVCEGLAHSGWIYADESDHENVHRETCLYPDDLLAWLRETQPKTLETLTATHGEKLRPVLLKKVRRALDTFGTLHILRKGVEFAGLRQPIQLVKFPPAFFMNTEVMALYRANRLRVVRQVHYSVHGNESLDLVLFVNGIPVATCELKSDYTQAIEDAVAQYRQDRLPKRPGRAPEPLLSFPGGALVHFAVSNSEVRMTTKLEGSATEFLPFNRGNQGGAGNAPNPSGYATSYLWEEVLKRESLLDILGRYLVPVRNKKKQLERILFPRYHQWDAARKILAAVKAEGVGGRYLIQHSAGSGKTNTIAWTANFLADLHDASDKKVFDSVIVVSDRNAIDGQLREAILSFERTRGVVATITGERGSKSEDLARALKEGKLLIVCTLQTFPYALDKVQELAATEGKRFAVIADEAHSSQTGEASAKLRSLLSAQEIADLDLEDGGEIDTESVLAATMADRRSRTGITFVAFTATPKDKTLQLFGRVRDPTRPPGPDNLPASFHIYSMRQAIEEGFILDVLCNYTPYKVAYQLATTDAANPVVEKNRALKGVMGWVKLHPYNIAQKAEIVVEHYRTLVQPLLGGQGKAMVVTGSRKEAVRWQLTIRKIIAERKYPIDTLVAFSGEVFDPESAPNPVSEKSPLLNPTLKGRDTGDAFKEGDYAILLVANKFQTGYDLPILCGMYVDKRLSGIQAVQTLSRLNRAYPGKDTTFIVDFVNNQDEILSAFKKYYETAELEGVSDPEKIVELRLKLDSQELYDQDDVDRVVEVVLKQKSQKMLDGILVPIAERLLRQYGEAQKQFQEDPDGKMGQMAKTEIDALLLAKKDMGSFIRLYTFLSQIFDFGSTENEKRMNFFKLLIPLLTFGRESVGVDLSALRLTAYTLKNLGTTSLSLHAGDVERIKPSSPGGGNVWDPEKESLEAILRMVNDLFVGEIPETDKLIYVNGVIKGKLLDYQTLVLQAKNNTKDQFASSPDLDREILNAIMETQENYGSMSRQALESEAVRKTIKEILLGPAKLYDLLRGEKKEISKIK